MLKGLTVRGFKSLQDVTVEFPRMAVLFGPNAAGKSNLLDAIQALSRIGTQRTLADALGDPIRGYPIESFLFPGNGLTELLSAQTAQFSIEADLLRGASLFRYRVGVAISTGSGTLSVADEYLATLNRDGTAKQPAAIEMLEGKLRLRRKRESGKPRYEPLGRNYAMLSDARLGAPYYEAIEGARSELPDWRTYYLDPRVAMRSAQPPSDVRDIGVLGGEIAPFLYRLRGEHPKHFQAVSRTLRSIVPNVGDLTVDLDNRRGTLDILIRQAGVDYSSRIVSEGTLRVLALCAIAVNPWGGSLLAFEEPENGVHPRRLELIAQLLLSLALEQDRQVVVTTHSPLFCDAVLKVARSRPADIGLFNVRRDGQATVVQPFDVAGPLFQDSEISAALLVDPDSILKSKIVEFVAHGDFGLASGKRRDGSYERLWFEKPLAADEVAFDADVFLLRKATADALVAAPPVTSTANGPVESEPLATTTFAAETQRNPNPIPATQTLRISGSLPPELWNRLGTKILPKLHSGSNLKIDLGLSVSVSSDLASGLAADLRQILQELGLEQSLRVE